MKQAAGDLFKVLKTHYGDSYLFSVTVINANKKFELDLDTEWSWKGKSNDYYYIVAFRPVESVINNSKVALEKSEFIHLWSPKYWMEK